MKTYKFIIAVTLLFTGFATQSCLDYDNPTDDFREDDIEFEDVILSGDADKIDYMKEISEEGFDEAQSSLNNYIRMLISGQYCMLGGKSGGAPVEHSYQYHYVCTDGYAQYAVVPHYYFAYSEDHNYMSTYYINKSFNGGPNGRYTEAKNNFAPLLNHPKVDSIPELKAMALLLLDCISMEQADTYGPFPYQDFKNNKETGSEFVYNDVKTIYHSIEANIDTILACLHHYEARPDWYKTKLQKIMDRYMQVTQDAFIGNTGVDTWIRFANSLKLRLAMRIVKVEPEKAKLWAEEAVADGVIESRDHEIGLSPLNIGFTNPILQIIKWGDTRLSASLESLLASLNHPYMQYAFNKNSGVIINTQNGETMAEETKVVGLRAGGHFGEDQQYAGNQFIAYSCFKPEFIAMAPLYIMKWAEVDFLRAEGAIRGWNMGGEAEYFYNRGIDNAYMADPMMEDYDYADLVNAYKNLAEPLEYTYVDPSGETPNMPSVTKIGVKWNDGDNLETKLEKIITQKYIALYPNSYEAWTELRRTGYPKLFPVLNPGDGDGSLGEGDIIQRMPYPGTSDSDIRDITATGIPALGGPDQQATRLWWNPAGVGNF